MIEIMLLVIIFIIGIYFGSFFTLATYRLPKEENITHKHSYCPNCNNKLRILDLIPVLSYIFLGGKCRYCKNKIGLRYILFEMFTGITFVLFALSLKIDIYNLEMNKLIILGLTILYFASLFLVAGIDKEKGYIQKSVLIYGVFIALIYMIYSYTLNVENVYAYVIYLLMMCVLIILDVVHIRKKLKYNYAIQILILILYIMIFSGQRITIITILLTILAMGIRNIIIYFKNRNSNVFKQKQKNSIAFFICTTNILTIIISNFIINYLIK